ncbi:WYL domain-containing protein [Sanguibacter sp. 25GB23B1]|uniref:helix-turn-helix transcriptional regulator n=1 Tax=unclassified Sanguibacter TaxID=2645534 RepID=UPI0032AE8288
MTSTPSTTTTSRLLRLLSLLQTRRDWPGQVLADRLDITHRTVRRDVERLREMGYTIRALKGPAGGYRLDAGAELPPLLFDDDQVLALTVALQAANLTGAGIEEAAVRALTTVRQVMPPRLRHRLDALQFTAVPSRAGGAGQASPDLLVALSTAVRAREVLRFDYAGERSRAGGPGIDAHDVATDAAPSSRDAQAPRRVEPHGVVTTAGRWYLVAWDLDADDWRIFRADRVSPRTPTGPRFVPREIPGGSAHALVSARFKGSDDEDRWPCLGTVILDLPAHAVLPFAGDGTVEDLGPDRCSLTAGSWSWVALAASLGRFGGDIEVVEPPELVDAFGELATRYAAAARAPSAPGLTGDW